MPDATLDPHFDARFSEPDAEPTAWAEAEQELGAAELYWITTVRRDGRPHVTPLIGVWRDGALHVTTGGYEQKARNLAANPNVALTTGRNALHGGTDLVVEGVARRVTDGATLRALAVTWEEKYGAEWHFDVADGRFVSQGNVAEVYRVAPTAVRAFGKGPYSQTTWSFPQEPIVAE